VEPTIANEVGAADELLFGWRAENLESTLQAELRHRGFGGERAGDQHGAVDVVAFAMAGRALDDGCRLDDAGALRIVGVGIVFGVNGDDGRARTECGAE